MELHVVSLIINSSNTSSIKMISTSNVVDIQSMVRTEIVCLFLSSVVFTVRCFRAKLKYWCNSLQLGNQQDDHYHSQRGGSGSVGWGQQQRYDKGGEPPCNTGKRSSDDNRSHRGEVNFCNILLSVMIYTHPHFSMYTMWTNCYMHGLTTKNIRHIISFACHMKKKLYTTLLSLYQYSSMIDMKAR